MSVKTEVFKLPHHGSYPADIPGGFKIAMQFRDTSNEYAPVAPAVMRILLGFVQRAYPDVEADSILRYGNKCFTIVSERVFGEYLFIYRHDFTWIIGAMQRAAYDDWVKDKPYYAALPELPEC